jgi:hypothetical protein
MTPRDEKESARGFADAKAGAKDSETYNDFARGGPYREGYRKGRLEAEKLAEASAAVLAPSTPPPALPLAPSNPTPEAEEPPPFLKLPPEEPKARERPETGQSAPVAPDLEPQPPAPDDPEQLALFDTPPDWKSKWTGMPDFEQKDLTPWASLPVHFANRADRNAFAKMVGQTITDDTRSLWYPKAEIGRYVDKRYATVEKVNPRYPVYIISKGRWEKRLTADSLEKIGVPYRIVVEPQERDNYAAVIDPAKILVLPFSNLGQGSIPARNWVWEHAIAEDAVGAPGSGGRHWILDDNINGFYRLHKNLKVPSATGATFAAAEDFVDRYENVALAGFQYFMFASRKTVIPPYTLNTRIYSCILIKNDLTYRWRGRYNEDTDLSIRALKDGLCTVLFNAFLAWKMTTMTMKGGNTDSLYKIKEGEKDGRLLMAESLRDQHPDVVKIVEKWGRWQHSVNYRLWRDNKLVPRPGAEVSAEANNYGMKLEMVGDLKDATPIEPSDAMDAPDEEEEDAPPSP